jgi:hypothetical protein
MVLISIAFIASKKGLVVHRQHDVVNTQFVAVGETLAIIGNQLWTGHQDIHQRHIPVWMQGIDVDDVAVAAMLDDFLT